ncbi:MAG: acyltransferase [Thermoplasmatota archaeon]
MPMVDSITGKSIFKNGIIWMIYTIARPLPPSGFKNFFYRLGGAKIGKRVWISPYAVLDPVAPHKLVLEDDVFIGWGASILTHIMDQDHLEGPSSRVYKEGKTILKKGSFIGGFATVRCGVTVGRGAVVASDSVVTKDVPPNTLVMGIPAKPHRKKSERGSGCPES